MAISPSLECVDLALNLAKESFKERFVAGFTIGSLAHGGFAPTVSDVDLAFVIDPVSADDRKKMETINVEIKKSKAPLSDRVSIFWSDWKQLEKGEVRIGRFPAVDRLDFIDHRKLLWGQDSTNSLKTPTAKEFVVEAAEFSIAKLLTPEHTELILSADKLIQKGSRQVTKSVLFPVRFIYTAATGKIGTNEAAVEYWVQNYPDNSVKELVRKAFEWRSAYNEKAAFTLLPKNLSHIYLEYIRKYAGYCVEYGHPELARQLREWEPRFSQVF